MTKGRRPRQSAAPSIRLRVDPGPTASRFRLDDREHVARGQDNVLVRSVLDLGPAVLGVNDDVAYLDVDGHAVALIVDAARPDGQDLALLRLFLRRVRKDEAGSRRGFCFELLDHDAILKRRDGDRHCGSPFYILVRWLRKPGRGTRRRGGRARTGHAQLSLRLMKD